MASPICFWFDRHAVRRAFSRARPKTGNKIAARMAIIAMTTRSSISVKPLCLGLLDVARRSVPEGAVLDGVVMVSPGIWMGARYDVSAKIPMRGGARQLGRRWPEAIARHKLDVKFAVEGAATHTPSATSSQAVATLAQSQSKQLSSSASGAGAEIEVEALQVLAGDLSALKSRRS